MTNSLSWVPRLSISNNIVVTPSISAAAYSSGNQLGATMTLTNAARYDSQTGLGTTYLTSVTVIDRSGTSPLIDLWFFNQAPTLAGSGNNAPFNITGANMGTIVGAATVGGAYSSSSAPNGVSLDGNGLLKLMHTTSGANLYAVAIIRTAVTFLTTTDITFLFGFSID